MILYHILHESGRRIIFFPLSQDSRVSIHKTKHDFGNKEFKKLVNQVLKPLLENLGYSGNDYFYYRVRNNNYETILLGTSPYGKAICVNAEIKKSEGILDLQHQDDINMLTSISPTPSPWKRLSPDKQDCWWRFLPNEKENVKVIKEIYKLIKLEGEKYFKTYNS